MEENKVKMSKKLKEITSMPTIKKRVFRTRKKRPLDDEKIRTHPQHKIRPTTYS